MSQIEKLHELFLIDKQVRGITSRLGTAINRLKVQQTRLTQFQQQQLEMENQIKHIRAKVREWEKQIDEIEERIRHQRELMNSVKNNKEYSALLIEVNTLKIDKDKSEAEALEHMARTETLEVELTGLADSATQQNKLVALATTEVETCETDSEDKLEELNTKRTMAEQQLPLSVQSAFNRVAKIHEGEAMAEVVEESRRNKEYSCGGCYLSIPVEALNSLMMDTKEIVICPNCGRMLYINQQFKASFVK